MLMRRAFSTKICRDCKNYNGWGCNKYVITDIVTGEKSYYYAKAMRENEKKCGESAIHFEKNHYKIVTIPYYFVKNNADIFVPLGFLSLYGSMFFWMISRN
jgi:hypothetical protein